ncbi:MAG: protoporphyrinogen oxidase [Actinomycetota bacterium]
MVGGGIAGLVAARALADTTRVVLFEAEARLGGKILTTELEGGVTEAGPDSFLTRDPHAVRLCEELGLATELVAPAAFGAHIWIGDRLHPLPSGSVLGVPASPAAVMRSGILSASGAARALVDLVLPGPLTGPDVSVGSLVRRRFGAEVLERLVDPILAGTRAGSADDMSLAAAAPPIDAVARRHRSVLLGLMHEARTGHAGPPQFLGLRGGMQRLIERLRANLLGRVELRCGIPVTRVAQQQEGYVVETREGPVAVSGVVLAAPARETAELLEKLSPRAADELRTIEYASIALVNLVYPPGAGMLPASGSGILVPSTEGRTLAGCTWTSRKWPHLAPADGGLSFRCFVGRAGDDPALSLSNDELARRAEEEVRAALGWSAAARTSSVIRWPRAIPQYAVGHNERMDRVEAALSACPGVALAGAGYRGSGLPDCIRQGEEAAQRVLAGITAGVADVGR